MTAPVIRQFIGSIPDKGQAQTTFDTNVDAWLDWTTLQFAPDLVVLAPWIQARVLEVAATALSGDLPSITGQAGRSLVVNLAETAVGFAPMSGRNLIINGSGRVNQRAYVSAVATTVANQFTLDRWFVITSGQNLTFTGNDAGRTMTAPAGGVSQVIEGANIVGGTYVINWTGTATCTVGGVARLKGATFTLTANTNVTVRFSSGTYTDVQIELGTVATTFERLPINQEAANCDWYFRAYGVTKASQAGTGLGTLQAPWPFAPMRVTPTSAGVVLSSTNAASIAFVAESRNSGQFQWGTTTASASFWVLTSFTLSAELTA